MRIAAGFRIKGSAVGIMTAENRLRQHFGCRSFCFLRTACVSGTPAADSRKPQHTAISLHLSTLRIRSERQPNPEFLFEKESEKFVNSRVFLLQYEIYYAIMLPLMIKFRSADPQCGGFACLVFQAAFCRFSTNLPKIVLFFCLWRIGI